MANDICFPCSSVNEGANEEAGFRFTSKERSLPANLSVSLKRSLSNRAAPRRLRRGVPCNCGLKRMSGLLEDLFGVFSGDRSTGSGLQARIGALPRGGENTLKKSSWLSASPASRCPRFLAMAIRFSAATGSSDPQCSAPVGTSRPRIRTLAWSSGACIRPHSGAAGLASSACGGNERSRAGGPCARAWKRPPGASRRRSWPSYSQLCSSWKGLITCPCGACGSAAAWCRRP